MSKEAGVIKVKRGNQLLPVKEGTTFKPGGVERTTQMANGEVAGFSSKPAESELSLTLRSTPEMDVEELASEELQTYKIFMDTGEVWAMTGWVSEPPEITDDGGGWSVSVKGKAATRIAP